MFTTEAEWQRHLIAQARVHGWKVSVSSAAHSDPGIPDLTLIHPAGDVVFAELKTDVSAVTKAQRATIAAILDAGGDAYIWRPSQLPEVLERLARQEGRSRPSHPRPEAEMLAVALEAACAAHGLQTEAVVGPLRTKPLVAARQDFIVAARSFTSASLPAIGRVIHRDHSTVLHALRRAESSTEPSTELSPALEAIRLAISRCS